MTRGLNNLSSREKACCVFESTTSALIKSTGPRLQSNLKVKVTLTLRCEISVSCFTLYIMLLFYVHGKHLRSSRDGQLPNHTFPGQS